MTITSRDPKGRHATGLFEAAYNDAGLDDESAQRLNENGGEFKADILAVIQKHSVTNQFADEELATDYTYPDEYTGPAPIVDQIKAIAAIFGLDPTQALDYSTRLPELPKGAEGWFAIPCWEKVAATYGEAVERVLAKLKEKRTDTVVNYREGQLGPEYLRISTRTRQHMQVAGTQLGDILLIAAQFGKRHRGRSVRRARECFTVDEFGLGAFAVGCMTLTHPTRFKRWEQLHTDCAGDEFAPGADGGFSSAPFFGWDDGKLEFNADYVGNASRRYGTSSAFLPQQ